MGGLWLFLPISAVFALQTSVIVTEKTPFPIAAVLASLEVLDPLPVIHINSSDFSAVLRLKSGVFLDYSYSPGLSVHLQEEANEGEVYCVYEDCPLARVKPSAEDTATHIATSLTALNLTKCFLGVTITPFYQEVARLLQSQFPVTVTQVAYLRPSMSVAEMEQVVGRVLKPAASSVAVWLVDEATGRLLHPVLADFDLLKPGYVYLFSAEAMWSLRAENIIFITDAVAVNATSRIEYEALIVMDLLRKIEKQGIGGVGYSSSRVLHWIPIFTLEMLKEEIEREGGE